MQRQNSCRVQTPSHHSLPLVPEINGEDPFSEENEEQLLYRVPVFYPFVNEFCTEMGNEEEADYEGDLNLAEFLSCDAELAEFAADVESLLGKGNEEDSGCGINDLDGNRMKVEDEDEDEAVIGCHFDPALDMELNWDFDYATFAMDGEDTKKVGSIESMENIESGSESQVKKKLLLRLNYEAVMEDWATQGCPWTNGVRPHEFNLDEFKHAHRI